MTQAQLDLQTQLEQTPSDLTTQPLSNDSPILFLEPIDQVHTHVKYKLNKRNITPPLQKIKLLQIIHKKHHYHRKRNKRS